MGCSRLGDEVAVGLLAGPEKLCSLRESIRRGRTARAWRRLEQKLDSPETAPLPDLAFGAAVSRRGDWARAAAELALEVARVPFWGEPEAGCLGLTGMHRAFDLCLALDWLWPVLPGPHRGFLLEAVLAKAVENLLPEPLGAGRAPDGAGQLLLARRMDRSDPQCLHPFDHQLNNWDMWFSCTLQMAARLAERAWLRPPAGAEGLLWGRHFDTGYELDQARVERWKALARERIAGVLRNQVGPEGDYAEGLSYATYGGKLLILPTGDDPFIPGLLAMPQWIRNQYPADLAFGAANFNDSWIRTDPPAALLAAVAAHTQDPALQALAEEALDRGSGADYLLLLSLDPDLPAGKVSLPAAAAYSRTGQVVWRTAEDRNGVYFALQCGAHGGAHQHCDRGTFFLSAWGEPLLVDSGDCRYVEPPPDPDGFDTRAHNCLLLDGQGQVGDNLHPTRGYLKEHEHEGDLSAALAEMTACYRGPDLVRRRVVFLRPDLLLVADRVEGAVERVTFLLQGYNPDGRASWACSEGTARLERPGARLQVCFFEPVESWSVHTGALDGEPKGNLRLETEIRGGTVTALLVPLRGDEPEATVEREGDGGLRVSFRGRTHHLRREGERLIVSDRSFEC